MFLGEYDAREDAEAGSLENVGHRINESFGDLKAHEALIQIRKRQRGPKMK